MLRLNSITKSYKLHCPVQSDTASYSNEFILLSKIIFCPKSSSVLKLLEMRNEKCVYVKKTIIQYVLISPPQLFMGPKTIISQGNVNAVGKVSPRIMLFAVRCFEIRCKTVDNYDVIVLELDFPFHSFRRTMFGTRSILSISE